MISFVSAMILVQASTVQVHAGVALAPGNQRGPVARVAQSWPLAPNVAFQLEGAFGIAGVGGVHAWCTVVQCFMSDVRFRAWEVEIPALLTVSTGPLFLRGGPVVAVRMACNGDLGGIARPCYGSPLAWGGAVGIGIRPLIGARRLTVEARVQRFHTPLVSLSTTDAGYARDFRPQAVTLTVGWNR